MDQSLFKEHRFVFDITGGASGMLNQRVDKSTFDSDKEAARKAADALQPLWAKGEDFIREVGKYAQFEGSDQPELIMQNADLPNIFLEDLLKHPDLESLDPTKIAGAVMTPDSLNIKLEDGSEILIDGNAFIALNWPQHAKDLKPWLLDNQISPSYIKKLFVDGVKGRNGADIQDLKIFSLIKDIVTDKRDVGSVPKDVIDEARAEIEDKLKFYPAERKAFKEEVERHRLQKTIRDQKSVAETNQFLGALANWQNMLDLDEWRASYKRRERSIDPKSWNPTHGVDAIRRDWQALGIFADLASPFRTELFAQLGKSSNISFLNTFPIGSQERRMYSNPLDHIDLINNTSGVPKDPDFPKFKAAINYFVAVKKIILRQDKYEQEIEKNIQQGEGVGMIDATLDTVKSAGKDFIKAVKRGDWGTALVYGLGVYLGYKTLETLPKEKSESFRKWAFRLGFGAMAYTISKRLGFDPFEKLGITDMKDALGGTMGAMFDMDLPGVEMDKVSPKVFRGVMYTNTKDLHAAYLNVKSGKNDQWIDPAKFGTLKHEFAGMHPGMLDTVKDKNPKLSHKQAAYEKAGRELYVMANALEEAYNKTWRQQDIDDGYYLDKSFEDALADSKEGILNQSSVVDFIIATRSMNHRAPDKSLIGADYYDKMHTRIEEAFAGQQLGLNIVESLHSSGAYIGRVMDYPVAIVPGEGGKDYVIYPYKEWIESQGNVRRSQRLTEIKEKAGAGDANAVNVMKDAIKVRIENMTNVFSRSDVSNVEFRGLRWHPDGKWRAELIRKTGSFNNLLPNAQVNVSVEVVPGEDGSSINVMRDDEVIIHIEDVLDQHNLLGNMVISALVNQKTPEDFAALHWLHLKGGLKFRDEDPDDNKFWIQINKYDKDIEMQFDGTSYSFVDPSDEARLLDNATIRFAIAEAAANNEQLQKPIDAIKKLVKDADEEYLSHLYKSIPDWFTKATWAHPAHGVKMSNFTGSVPKNYTLALIDSQQDYVMRKLMNRMDGMTDISLVGPEINKTVGAAKAGFNQLQRDLNRLITGKKETGEDFDRTEFQIEALDRLVAIGIDSNNYAGHRKNFANLLIGKLGEQDFTDENIHRFQRIMAVFNQYTSMSDDPRLDGADLSKPNDPLTLEYKKNLAWMNYVATEIFNRMTENQDFKHKLPPDPSDFWLTVNYAEFDPTKHIGREYFDGRETIKMRDRYTEFDANFLALPRARKDELHAEGLVLLPKKSMNFTITDAADARIFVQLFKATGGGGNSFEVTVDNVKQTETEMLVTAKVQKVLQNLKDKYGDRVKEAEIDNLMENYKPVYKVTRTGGTIDLKYGVYVHNINPSTGVYEGEDFVEVDGVSTTSDYDILVADIERELTARGVTRTVTRTEQLAFIDEKVTARLHGELVDRNFNKYFKPIKGPGKWVSEVWDNIKHWAVDTTGLPRIT